MHQYGFRPPPKEEIEEIEETTLQGPNDDPWNWSATRMAYKQKNKYLIETYSEKYDIAKMGKSRQTRHSSDGKDPLEGWAVSILTDSPFSLA